MTPRRIVVINDSADFLDTVTEVLGEAGHRVSGHGGDQLTADDIAAMAPDLVILDLVLRHRELAAGWDLLVLIRSHPDLATVPLIVCSGDVAQLRKRETELATIANTHVLPKPFTLDRLEAVVDEALGDAKREAS